MSTTSPRDWRIRATPETPGAATITDRDAGLTYTVTIGKGPGQVWLTSLTITTTRKRQRIDHDVLARLPVTRLAEAVARHLAPAAPRSRRKRQRPGPPDLRELAALYKKGETRQTLAPRYGASISTVDRWLGEARRAGLIPPARTGRNPNPPTRKADPQ
jgi:hypothetical protein